MLCKKRKYIYLVLLISCFCTGRVLHAQSDVQADKIKTLILKGDSLREQYRFDESLAAYEAAIDAADDSLHAALKLELHDKILMSENGRSMMGFVDIPHVISKTKFSIKDFFLFYPLEDGCWRKAPNQLDSSGNHSFVSATFVRDQDKVLYWSAEDNEGIRNIYTSSLRGDLWSIPSLLNEQMTSASDEIYPMLSPDGKSLFFASEGLYGVGGYDIYVSRWNEDTRDWGAPVNLGFPYSSPADDFLYIDTDDGHHSMFASNRGCSKDSVWVYALEFDNVPVRRSIEDPKELMDIAELNPELSLAGQERHSLPSDSETGEYLTRMKIVLSLKDSLAHYVSLAAEGYISDRLDLFKDSLQMAQTKLQQLEMRLLMKGIVVDPDKFMVEEKDQPEVARQQYVFTKKNFGPTLNLQIEVPEVKFDYSFKVLDVAQYAQDQSIPSGVVYQIQIFATKKKVGIKSLKGLSPVYEAPGANGHLVYRVGLFRSYADVLSHLNTVKKVGFRNAFIAAFIDGKAVTVAKARAQEKVKPVEQHFYEVRIAPKGGELDSGIAAGIRQQAAGKDIARTVGGDGVVRFVVGPFADKAKADELTLFVKAMGISEVECGIIRK